MTVQWFLIVYLRFSIQWPNNTRAASVSIWSTRVVTSRIINTQDSIGKHNRPSNRSRVKRSLTTSYNQFCKHNFISLIKSRVKYTSQHVSRKWKCKASDKMSRNEKFLLFSLVYTVVYNGEFWLSSHTTISKRLGLSYSTYLITINANRKCDAF